MRELEEGVFSAAVLDSGSMGDDTVLLSRTLRASSIPFMYYTGHGDLDATVESRRYNRAGVVDYEQGRSHAKVVMRIWPLAGLLTTGAPIAVASKSPCPV